MRFCRGMTFGAIVAITAILFACFSASASASMGITCGDLKNGAAISVDGRPAFLRYDGDVKPGDTLKLRPAGLDHDIDVTALPDPAPEENILILPVQIEDKSLARGVTMELMTPKGNRATIKLPPKRVFLSIPFTIPVTGDAHSDFAESENNMILQIVPKITKKAQVSIDNTSNEGLVADIRYEGLAYMKFKDVLNRSNKRDMDGTFFIGKEKDYQWALITENLFEKYDDRTVGAMKNHRFSKTIESKWRFDNIHNIDSARIGGSATHRKGKAFGSVGNLDRIVKDRMHAEIGYGTDLLSFMTRFEGLEAVNPSNRAPLAMKVDRWGYQAKFAGGDDNLYYEGRAGNLKVQDYNDEGEIDDYFNFDIRTAKRIGGRAKRGRGWSPSKFTYSGEIAANFWGRGSSSWVQGATDFNLGYMNDYLAYLRFNNDFARITGKVNSPLWESLFISLMRNRNYFNPRDPMAKYGLDSLFLDFEYTRKRKGVPYDRRTRFGIARFMKVWKYDLPIEFFVERVERMKFRPGVSISIRRYL